MGRRGPNPARGLLWNSGKRQWYKVIGGEYRNVNGKSRLVGATTKSFGKAGVAQSDQKSKREAERLYDAYRQATLSEEVADHAVRGVPVAVENGKVTAVKITVEYPNGRIEVTHPDGSEQTTYVDAPRQAHPTTCKMVVDAYLEYLEKECSAYHCNDVKNRLPKWLDFIGPDTPVESLTHDSFVRYRDKLTSQVSSGELSQTSTNKMCVLVKGAFTAAQREKGWPLEMQCGWAKVLRTKRTIATDKPIFSPDDVSAMLTRFADDPHWTALCLVALNAAMSNTDMSSMTWGRIDWTAKLLNYPRGKNMNPRRIPLWQRTIAALKKHRQTSKKIGEEDLVFPFSDGAYIRFYANSRTDNLTTSFADHAKALDFKHSFGTFRKSAATTAKITEDEGTVAMILGNAGLAVWRRYTMAIPDVVRSAVQTIEGYYFPPKPKAKPKKKAGKK